MAGANGWNEWRNHVLQSLERLHEQNVAAQEEAQHARDAHSRQLSELSHALMRTQLQVAGLKMQARMWGGISGSIFAAILLIISKLIDLLIK